MEKQMEKQEKLENLKLKIKGLLEKAAVTVGGIVFVGTLMISTGLSDDARRDEMRRESINKEVSLLCEQLNRNPEKAIELSGSMEELKNTLQKLDECLKNYNEICNSKKTQMNLTTDRSPKLDR